MLTSTCIPNIVKLVYPLCFNPQSPTHSKGGKESDAHARTTCKSQKESPVVESLRMVMSIDFILYILLLLLSLCFLSPCSVSSFASIILVNYVLPFRRVE